MNYYAGFWKRLLAYIIDQILLGIFSFILIVPLLFIIGFSVADIFHNDDFNFSSAGGIIDFSPDDEIKLFIMLLSVLFIVFISVIVKWLYYALFESSGKQATVGKMLLGLKVADLNNHRIGFGRASGRFFGKILSSVILNFGYLMIAFTEKKQGLHDMLAGTVVIDSNRLFMNEIITKSDI
ncbi:MAG: RDD family protein [Melioribacteraceae bacterium]|nr:RDD family protein [Melioribacteraceae bacterium]